MSKGKNIMSLSEYGTNQGEHLLRVYLVDDPIEHKVHKFFTKKELVEFLSGPDFDGDPYDEVIVYEATPIRPQVSKRKIQ